MNAREYEEIKSTIESLKEKRSKANGAIENIEKDWEEMYGFSSLEEAENTLQELTKTITEEQDRLDTLYKDLQGMADWKNL